MPSSELMNEFLEEYRSEQSIRRYTRATAGNGIGFLLDHDYGQIYLDVIHKYLPQSRRRQGIRVWEFGCGGGMNLLHLVSLLERHRVPLDCAYGSDFSDVLVEAANREATRYLPIDRAKLVSFCMARNEDLPGDVAKCLGRRGQTLLGSFDLMIGVNTIRYSHRLAKQNACSRGIYELLAPGGVCVVIDMNNKFPAFRSHLRERLHPWRAPKDHLATYLPTLEEYARPFAAAGFEILRKDNFCWVPHSAGPGLTRVMRVLTPVLNTVARAHAMRSLVIARKNQQTHA